MQYTHTSKIANVIKRDGKVLMTTTKGDIPLVAERGEGDFIYDISGNRFVDFSSFISVYNFGVNSTRQVRDAIKRQVDTLMHSAFTDYYAQAPVAFAENLITMFPSGFGRVFFSNSGTEANEAAIKFSRYFSRRQYMMGFYNAFHGRTMGALSLTISKGVQRGRFGPFGAAVHAPYAYCYRCPLGKEYPSCALACVDHIKKAILSKEVSPKEVAAIFMEPVQGEGGYIVPPKEFAREIRAIADDNGIILVSDEVQAGYMRTGKFLAMDNFGVKADIYTMAKAVGAGLPMGVTVTRKSLGDMPLGAHSNTFGGNLAAVAGADAQLRYVKSHMASLASQASSKGALITKRLRAMANSNELIGDVRGLGLMIGVEFVKDRKSKEPAVKERDAVLMESFKNGLVMLPCGESSIRIIPPLTISIQHLRQGLDILEDAIEAVAKKDRKGS